MNNVDKVQLSELGKEFIQASQIERARSIKEEDERIQRELETAQQLAEESEARRKAEEKARFQAEQRVAQQAIANKKLRKRAIALALSLMMAIAAGVLAWFNQQQADREKNQALRTQSLFLADLAQQEINNGDLINGILLALEALPENIFNPNRPYVSEAEIQLNRAIFELFNISSVFLKKQNYVVFPREKRVIFSKNSTKLITFNRNYLHLWDVQNGKLLNLIEENLGGVNIVYAIFSPNNQHLITSAYDDITFHSDGIKLWDTNSGERLHVFGDKYQLGGFFTPDSRYLITRSERTGNIYLWNVNNGKLVNMLKEPKSDHPKVYFSIGGQFIATLSSELNEVFLWEVNSGRLLNVLKGTGYVTEIVFSPDSQYIITLYSGDDASLWKIDSDGQTLNVLNLSEKIATAYFSPNSMFIVTTDAYDDVYYLWESNSGELINRFISNISATSRVSISPDSRLIAATHGYLDNSVVYLWELNSGQLLNTLEGHVNEVEDITFSPDGKHLVTTSTDSVRLWEVNSGKLLNAIEWHKYVTDNISSFTPDDEPIFRASKNNTTQKLIDYAKEIVPRCFTKAQRQQLFLPPTTSHTLIEDAEKLAQIGHIDEAIALFKQARSLRLCHKFDPTHKAQAIDMIEKGKHLAQQGQIETAVALFKKAQKINPEYYARQFAASTLEKRLASQGKIEQVIALIKAYNEAPDIDVEISATIWNRICWDGSLNGYAAQVMDACAKAVEIEPLFANYYKSRGVARALTGNTQGAIEDFFSSMEDMSLDDESKMEQLLSWIEALRRGENPFTPEELERLRSEYYN